MAKTRIVVVNQDGGYLGRDLGEKQAFTGTEPRILEHIPNIGDELVYKNFRSNESMKDHILRTQTCIVTKVSHEIEEDWNSSFKCLVTVYVKVLFDKEE